MTRKATTAKMSEPTEEESAMVGRRLSLEAPRTCEFVAQNIYLIHVQWDENTPSKVMPGKRE